MAGIQETINSGSDWGCGSEIGDKFSDSGFIFKAYSIEFLNCYMKSTEAVRVSRALYI